MTEEFHELFNVSEIADAAALTIPRAKALFDSVVRQRDYTVVQLLQHSADDVPMLECLVVEVECDGVPPKNTVGINYRERLALCVPDDPKLLIEVLALRKDFPVLMHQNQGIPVIVRPAPSLHHRSLPGSIRSDWNARPSDGVHQRRWCTP